MYLYIIVSDNLSFSLFFSIMKVTFDIQESIALKALIEPSRQESLQRSLFDNFSKM